eukprot:TRINITY_DN2108_c0_g1_i4.p1 TRINITY_DN2108_c0_g1~~TRINITY_DN2108_c0_g1_i4.p1  ORF type:complete len:984 (+),score=190.00 TRINITY_DN2108_c0_g1_i4:64-3015(+)
MSSQSHKGLAQIEYADFKAGSEKCIAEMYKAAVGDESFGAILIRNVPGLAEAKRGMFEPTAKLMFGDVETRRQHAQVRRIWPGFKSTIDFADPLQGGFLHNPQEMIGVCEVDPFSGRNQFANEEHKSVCLALDLHVYDVTLCAMRACDTILKKELGDAVKDRPTMEEMIEKTEFAFANFKCYESDFSRTDDTEDKRYAPAEDVASTKCSDEDVTSNGEDSKESTTKASKDGKADLCAMRTSSTAVRTTKASNDGKADLCAMRTSSTAVRTTKASNDGKADLCAMRTSSTAVRTTKASNDVQVEKDAYGGKEDGEDDAKGTFWLPWHLDPNFVSTLTGDSYFDEKTGQLVHWSGALGDPDTGLVVMNKLGEVVGLAPLCDDSTMIFLIGTSAQVYSGGVLRACRHAVKRLGAKPGLARCVFNTFYYGQWDTVYSIPAGKTVDDCINIGWNGMMDRSSVNLPARGFYTKFRRNFQEKIGNETGPEAELFEQMSKVLPDTLASFQGTMPTATIDFISDLSCPVAYITFKRLEQALAACSAESKVQLRFPPLLLNPDQVREPMSSYMLRNKAMTMDQVRSADTPQNKAAKELGFSFDYDRPVINTVLAHCAVEAAERQGGIAVAHKVYKKLAKCYHEEGKDISEVTVIKAVFEELGLKMDSWETAHASGARVMKMHHTLQQHVQSVPYTVLRNSASGSGLMVDGPASEAYLSEVLMRVLQPIVIKDSGGNDLLFPATCAIPGFSGRPAFVLADRTADVWSSTLSIGDWSGPASWPYKPEDFSRLDESDDGIMYQSARIGVQHIDQSATKALESTYRKIFSTAPCAKFAVLDLCSSWTSHYPRDLVQEAHIDVHGINMEELLANDLATVRTAGDLNTKPKLDYMNDHFHFVTMALSVDYLTKPREVFQEMHRVLKPGGVAVLSFSNRCFETKVIKKWLKNMDEGLALVNIVKNYFRFGPNNGWSHISSLDVTRDDGEDPVWVVTAVKK